MEKGGSEHLEKAPQPPTKNLSLHPHSRSSSSPGQLHRLGSAGMCTRITTKKINTILVQNLQIDKTLCFIHVFFEKESVLFIDVGLHEK